MLTPILLNPFNGFHFVPLATPYISFPTTSAWSLYAKTMYRIRVTDKKKKIGVALSVQRHAHLTPRCYYGLDNVHQFLLG